MGSDERPPAGALIGRLLSQPQGFNLFQAISLLERAVGDAERAVGESHGVPEAVRLKAVVSLGFQPSDVSAIQSGPHDGYTLLSPVLSLAGGQGPLPLPFTEQLLQRKFAGDHATADFLDIFNHRLLAFLYRSRKKHHLGLSWRSPQVSPLANTLDAVSALGLRSGRQGPGGAAVWIRHAGLLGGAPRSLVGLLAMLTDRLGHKVRGRQFIGEWQYFESGERSSLITRTPRLQPRLGHTAVVGLRYWYQAAGFELEFSRLGLRSLRRLLPDGEDQPLLGWLIRRYLQQEFSVRLKLRLSPEKLQRTELEWPRITHRAPARQVTPLRLGWTSWLITRQTQGDQLPAVSFRLGRQPDALTPVKA